jgi:hypothetical protein
MNTLRHLSIVLMVLTMSAAARGDDTGAQQVAKAPAETTGSAHDSCVTHDIETLSWGSDFSSYMAADCPADVRARALRQLWRTMPPPSGPQPTEF